LLEDWKYEPARDLGLRAHERRLSLRREVGLISASGCLLWRGLTRTYLGLAHRLTIRGRENLPLHPPFILVANHASHLDAVILAGMLPARYVGNVFPIAAGDTFFTKPATSIFATAFMNALPLWRHSCGTHSLDELRNRLTSGSCVYIIFPEGTRTRDGAIASFKPGIGRLVAGTSLPVVPCYLHGTFHALPASRSLPRPGKVYAIIGQPLQFESATNDRSGWDKIAAALEEAVRRLEQTAAIS
jgi:1-acyl-sn-glycerol-3-phosphate acyltransferase